MPKNHSVGLYNRKSLHTYESCKNLFLKDSRGKYFLAILPEDKKMRINEIAKIANATHMSFGKEEELMDILKLTRGCVSPFGIINDVNNVNSFKLF